MKPAPAVFGLTRPPEEEQARRRFNLSLCLALTERWRTEYHPDGTPARLVWRGVEATAWPPFVPLDAYVELTERRLGWAWHPDE